VLLNIDTHQSLKFRAAIALILGALCLTGCPEISESTAGPVDTCVEAGVQCRYAPGKIGVCFANTHGVIECRSQH